MNTNKLSTKEKIGYGLGDTASNFFFQTFNIFLLYYYTDVFGLAPAAVGTMFLLARFWDAVNDPMMGVLADRTVTKHGKYRPYLLWVAIPYGVLGYMIFANPDLGPNGKLIYAYVTYISMMMAYTAINVPYSALMGVMTPSSLERTSLSSYRFVCAFGGGFLVSLAVRPLVRELGGGDEVKGFQYTMAIFAVVSIILFWFTFATTRERVKPVVQKLSLREDFSALLRNTPWLVMVAAAVLTLSNVAVRGAVTVHYFKYVVGDTGESFLFGIDRTTLVMSSGMLAFIVGVFFTGHVGKLFGKRNALMICTLLNAATVLGFYFIPPDHLWVDSRVAPGLLGALRKAIRDFYGDDPQRSPDYGRIIHRRHFDRLHAMLNDCHIAHGGGTDKDDLYLEPTILTDVAENCAAMGGEIFGPILPVIEYDDIDDVLTTLRGQPTPLALYLFTADRALQNRVLAETRSGGVCINDTISHIIGRDLPFGGVGESGMGSYHGRASFECFTHQRAVLRRSLRIDPAFRYPPPRVSLATLKRLMRYFG